MKLETTEEIKRLESLSMLRLTEEDREAMVTSLQHLLQYVESLDALDTGDVPMAVHLFPAQCDLREDEPGEELGAEAVLSNAPEKKNGYVVVPATRSGRRCEE